MLEGTVVPGTRVLLLDDLNGWWPASGTALHLALQRHQVTLVTSAEQVAAVMSIDVELNAQGLEVWLERRKK